MKVLNLLGICVFYLYTRSSYANPSINYAIHEKCHDDRELTTFTDIHMAGENLANAVLNITQVPTSSNKDYMKLCEPVARDQLYTLTVSFAEKILLCLSEEELYLPDFLLGTFNNSMGEFCKSDGWTQVWEFTDEIANSNCSLYSVQAIKNICIPKLNAKKNLVSNNYVLTQNELCSDLESLQDCSRQIFERCGEYLPSMVKFTMAPALDWCNRN